MNYQIGVADYGMDVWYGGSLNLAQRLELLKSCGIGGIEWLKAADMAEAVQNASLLFTTLPNRMPSIRSGSRPNCRVRPMLQVPKRKML